VLNLGKTRLIKSNVCIISELASNSLLAKPRPPLLGSGFSQSNNEPPHILLTETEAGTNNIREHTVSIHFYNRYYKANGLHEYNVAFISSVC